MKKFIKILKLCPLFSGIGEANLQALLDCLSARLCHFEKNSFIFSVDEEVKSVGIVLSGAVHILQEDFWGNRVIMARIEPGGSFGEAFSCAGTVRLPVGVLAAEESDIVMINCKRIITSCSSACKFHSAMIKNLLRVMALNNLALTQKLEHITRRNTREKLLSYLSEQARLNKSNKFIIPFSRQELADYLSVDRSAMSGELSKMKAENLLNYNRNHFELLQ